MFRLVKLKKSSKKGDTWAPINEIVYDTKEEGLKDVASYRTSQDRQLVARCIPADHMIRVCDVLVPHWGYPY